ncbi:hypothetical protein [Providencia sp.]
MFTLQEQESTVIKTNLVHSSGRHIFWRFYFGTVHQAYVTVTSS